MTRWLSSRTSGPPVTRIPSGPRLILWFAGLPQTRHRAATSPDVPGSANTSAHRTSGEPAAAAGAAKASAEIRNSAARTGIPPTPELVRGPVRGRDDNLD